MAVIHLEDRSNKSFTLCGTPPQLVNQTTVEINKISCKRCLKKLGVINVKKQKSVVDP